MSGINCELIVCNSISMFKNRIDNNYLVRAGYMWTSLSAITTLHPYELLLG